MHLNLQLVRLVAGWLEREDFCASQPTDDSNRPEGGGTGETRARLLATQFRPSLATEQRPSKIEGTGKAGWISSIGTAPQRDFILKVGVHRGASIAVTLNERLDYFGQTVNIAARVQSLAGGDEVCITEEVYGAPGVAEIIAPYPAAKSEARSD